MTSCASGWVATFVADTRSFDRIGTDEVETKVLSCLSLRCSRPKSNRGLDARLHM